MKKVALLVYDDFSLREVADLMYLFRWSYEIPVSYTHLTLPTIA